MTFDTARGLTVLLVLTLSGGVTPSGQQPASSAHPAVSPDGTQIVFDSDRTGNGDIYVMNADGSGVRRLTDHPAMEMGAEWWDGGARIVFQRYEGRPPARVYLMDPDGTNVRPLADPRRVHWSSSVDGSLVLTGPLSDAEGPMIWIQRADGGDRHLLTTFRPGSFNSDMSFSPDGATVLFESFIGSTANGGIYVVDRGGGTPQRLADGTDPSWSPDGHLIAFKIHEPETDRYWLHVMNADGSNNRQLAQGAIPSWFPDSRHLAYMARVADGWQIHVVDVVSGAVTPLTP